MAGINATAIHRASQAFVRASWARKSGHYSGGGDQRHLHHNYRYREWSVEWRIHSPCSVNRSNHPPDVDDQCIMKGPGWEVSFTVSEEAVASIQQFTGCKQRFEEDMIMAKLLA